MYPSTPQRIIIAAFLTGTLVPVVAVACLWDADTIRMERSRFPSTLELITGKFLRHTEEFYHWRIKDRLKRLEADPTNAALLDDLAVAYDKTGQHDLAVETALKTESLHPGRYETAANLGTFYIHAGRPEEGLPHITRALEINPDAHFGREKYQKLLVEYALHPRDGQPLPLANVTVHPEQAPESSSANYATAEDTFADFIRGEGGGYLTRDETAAAVKGVLGIMRFGKHDSPVILEALGTLLGQFGDLPDADAKLLAARAFLKASYEVPDGPARAAYRAMAARALILQTPRGGGTDQISLEQVEAEFQKELEEARTWYAELSERELSWIRDGKNPEAEFDRLYDAEPELSSVNPNDAMPAEKRSQHLLPIGWAILILVVVAGLGGALVAFRRGRRGRA